LRRVVGLILLGLGVFAVAMAVLLPTYVYPKLAKVPLDQNSTSVLEGDVSRVLAVTSNGAELRDNTHLKAVAKVQANFERPEMKAGTDVAVWLLAVQVTDKDGTVVSATKRQVCFDRRTAVGSEVENESQPDTKCDYKSTFVTEADKEKTVKAGDVPPEKQVLGPQPGLQFKFPFGTEKKEYQVYQDSVRKAVPAKFVGEDKVSGIDVYKFEQDVPDTQIGRQTVPGSLIDQPDQSVEVLQYYKGTVSMWVEPVTGVILKQSQFQHQELRLPSATSGTIVFDGTLEYTPETIKNLVDQVNENKSKLELISSTGPISLGAGGGLMILIGTILLVLSRRSKQTPGDQTVPQHALAR
jgi:hypothetical protein